VSQPVEGAGGLAEKIRRHRQKDPVFPKHYHQVFDICASCHARRSKYNRQSSGLDALTFDAGSFQLSPNI
jgi:hypothetical protein